MNQIKIANNILFISVLLVLSATVYSYNQIERSLFGILEEPILTDSVNMQCYLYEASQASIEFELYKRDGQIEQQSKKIKQKTKINILLVILSVLLIIVSLLILRYLKLIQKKNKHLFLQIKELSEAKKELMIFKELIKGRVGGDLVCCDDKDWLLFEKIEGFMKKEKPYINSEYNRKNLISDMNTNEVYLSRAIKKGACMTIQEYINQWRVEEAKQNLLQNMETTIESIAFDSGFNSTRNFYRLFKETYGMSPNEFRNYVLENYKD
ncbi:AraC-like DNA-binding protein [Dysgonomonadaceae bacterium PH5-43]|nr:AraC-like DNA-binding protein [Dysgonomonadaceae bacterium PH5-43]